MSSKFRHSLAKSIKLKLVLLYSGLFIISSFLLFVAIYAYIASTLTQHDQNLMLTELHELANEYTNNGIQAIEKLIDKKRKFHQQHPFLVRIADTKNRTVATYLPSPWTEFNIKELEKTVPQSRGQWLKVRSLGGNHYLEVTSIRIQNSIWIQVGMSNEQREKTLAQLRSTFGIIIAPVLVLGFLCGWVVAYYVLRPIQNLVTAATSVRSGQMNARVPVRGTGDELDELAVQFNRMLQKISTLLNAMKNCLDNVAHDLRTPVTRLRNLAEKALQTPSNQFDQNNALSSCAEETERINVMLNTLLNISEAESGIMQIDLEVINIYRLVINIVDAYRLIADEKMIQIRVCGDGTLSGSLDPNRMSQVLANLLDNAIKYTPEGGEVSIEFVKEENKIIIRVQDNGIGIPAEELSLIWDRLYRGKQTREQSGLGLGLSQAKAIMIAHKGKIEVSSAHNKGSVFTICLPV